MSVRYSCLLCGIGIAEITHVVSERWLTDYRAVYRNHGKAFISDPNARDSVSNAEGLLEVPVMGEAAVEGLHGFVIHDACWHLLRKAGGASGFLLERLVDVCESLPLPVWFNGLHWGHDFGGRLRVDNEFWYPWKEIFEAPDSGDLDDLGMLHDPFRGPNLAAILSTPTPDAPTANAPLDPKGRSDCFCRLPLELREMILVHLATQDALNLRKVSWAFHHLFSSSAFWLSRFDPDRERGFLFEAKDKTMANDTSTLLRLYRLSRRSESPPELLNREGVWGVARRLLPLVRQPIMSKTSSMEPGFSDSHNWVSLSGDVCAPNSSDLIGVSRLPSRPTTTTEVKIPSQSVTIGIAIINTGIWDYVTGIRIFDKSSGEEQFAGYLFDNGEKVHNVDALHGFGVAMGPHGVRALQIVGPRQDACSWVGRTEGIPISERLVGKRPVNCLRVTVDGYKITALSVRCSEADDEEAPQPRDMSLRHVAIWYPEPPPEDLVLNDSSFTGLHPEPTTYQPLSWISFGGQRGKNLSHVQGVLVQFNNALRGLQFTYDGNVSEDGGSSSERLGRCGPTKMEGASLFPIDGPGGERISSVSVGLRVYDDVSFPDYLRHGVVQYLTISTNRGRVTCHGRAQDELQMRTIGIADGTTITGFYGHNGWEDGLLNLGVISEYL